VNTLTLKKQSTRKLTIKTGVKAGGLAWSGNHNQKVLRRLRVRTGVKAGALWHNHNQKVLRRSRVNAG